MSSQNFFRRQKKIDSMNLKTTQKVLLFYINIDFSYFQANCFLSDQ